MRCMLPALLAITIGCSSDKSSKSIEGTWLITDAQREGKYYNDPVDGKLALTFADGKVSGHIDDGGKEQTILGTYSVNPKADPPEIDMKLTVGKRAMPLNGVYELDGDKLTIGSSSDEGARPTEVLSKAGSKSEHLVFKRVKE